MSVESGKISVQTENIFPIIKKWLYSEKDIFLRELISNSVDAITKLKKVSLTEEFEGGTDYRIDITFDKEARTLSIEDNGIGRKNAQKNKKRQDHTSMALNITKERIDNLNKKYKTSGYLIIEDFDKNLETGTKVLISLPYKVDTRSKNNKL